MAANVESIFYVRTKPWHGLGTNVETAPTSLDALRLAGLDWAVLQRDVCTEDGLLIPGYKANVRDSDFKTLGIVTDRYQVVQNQEAFQFADELLGEGVRFETVGSIQEGKRIWILAKLPEKYFIAGDEIEPYFVLMNSHDGSCSIKAAMTPIRVVCQNTLNLALRNARRTWQMKHTSNIMDRMDEARNTLDYANEYMKELGKDVEKLCRIKLSERHVMEYIREFFPVSEDMSTLQRKNNMKLMNDMQRRYFDAPDLLDLPHNGYRFVNAVSDFATHSQPIRKSKNYKENLFLRTAEGNPIIDRAYQMILAS